VHKTSLLIAALLLGLSLLPALTLQEAKQQALAHNSAYLAQKQAAEAADWGKQQALSGLFPSLTAGAAYVYLDPAASYQSGQNVYTLNHDSRSLELSLYQPIFMGGKLWQAYRISGVSAEMAKLGLENARLAVLNATEEKYLNVLLLRQLLSIAEADLQSTVQSYEIAQVRFQNGTMSSADRNRVLAQKANKEIALIQAQTALQLAWQDLQNQLGLDPAVQITDLEDVGTGQAEELFLNLTNDELDSFAAAASRQAAATNLSLKTSAQSVELAKKAYSIAKGNFLPTVGLSLSRSFAENGFDRYEFEGSNTLALTASLPLLPVWKNYSGSRKAYHELQKARYEQQAATDGILLSVKAAALNLASAARQINAASIAYEVTDNTYLQMQERYKNNLLSTGEMLDAELMWKAAQTALVNARYAFLKARSALLQALGTDNEAAIISLLNN
jgi:outer membrane protein TolC